MNSKKVEVIDYLHACDLVMEYFYPTGREDDELLEFKEYMRDKYKPSYLFVYVLKKEKYHFKAIGAFIGKSDSTAARFYHDVNQDVIEFGKRYKKSHGCY